jgi:hypothetical protein
MFINLLFSIDIRLKILIINFLKFILVIIKN